MNVEILPWQRSELSDWSIVGISHYGVNGCKKLIVTMVRGNRIINESGNDDIYLWNRLSLRAMEINKEFE
jgi:hypothetical protein